MSHSDGFNTAYSWQKRSAEIADNIDLRKMRGKKKAKGFLLAGFVSRNCLFEYQLYRGEGIFPRTCFMTRLESRKRNKELERAFMKRLKEDPNAILWSWRYADLKKVKDLTYHFYERFCTCVKGEVKGEELFKWWNDRGIKTLTKYRKGLA